MKNLFIRFTVSYKGRALRVIFGMMFLAYGFEVNPLFIFIGVLPLLAGVFDLFFLAPLFGLSVEGEKIRKKLKK